MFISVLFPEASTFKVCVPFEKRFGKEKKVFDFQLYFKEFRSNKNSESVEKIVPLKKFTTE